MSSPLLLAPLAAAVAGGGSLLSAGLIIWAMSGWVCLSRRIRVISRVNAAGSSTSSFASASGLSRTMAMSISPPSLWIIVGRPACTSARIATALFSHKVRSHSSRALCARVSVCVKTRERRGSSFSQLGLEPNRTGLTAQSLFFLEESCRVKRSDTQTSSNFSNYFKRVLKLQKRSSSFSK